ncbi:MAG: chemotaxis protein CheC [Nitrospirota bacterium]|nr:chemotaxis protein CheC [Nitrospirota bacterium]MDH5585301.1 chemotaxis protein CheC [Nitrospirota bacterium]MDH5773735.1 chemotaxis protein CheC [Nitrospirota bacterium]
MYLSPEQLESLQELLNIGVGRAAGSLNQMLEKPIRLHIPSLQLGKMDDLTPEVQKMKDITLSSVQLPFKGTFSGSSCLLFPTESAKSLVIALTGEAEDPDTMDSLREATLTEIGNIVLNGVMGSLANVLNHRIIYSVPFYQETSMQGLLQPTPSDSSEIILWAKTQFTIEEYNLTGDIMLMFGIPDLGLLVNAISEYLHPTSMPHVST